MPSERKPLISIQNIVPSVEDYIIEVEQFYEEKLKYINQKINQFIEIAKQLPQIPEHLTLEFIDMKNMAKATQKEKVFQKLMVRNQIKIFINLRQQVFTQAQGNKFVYPELPKVHRRNYRKRSSADHEEGEEKDNFSSLPNENQNHSTLNDAHMSEICGLFSSFNIHENNKLQVVENEKNLCEQIDSIVESLNQMNLEGQSEQEIKQREQKQFQDLTEKVSMMHIEQRQMSNNDRFAQELNQLRLKKKAQLFDSQQNLREIQSLNQLDHQGFRKHFCQSLQELKSLFLAHLQSSVQKSTKIIKQLLIKITKELKDRESDCNNIDGNVQSKVAYIPLHKVSAQYHKLNSQFYRTQNLVKCLQKYLTKKIKECIIDTDESIKGIDGQIFKQKMNFRLRFFKHILLESMFFVWLRQAILDMKKMSQQGANFGHHKSAPSQSGKIELDNEEQETASLQEELPKGSEKRNSQDEFVLFSGNFLNYEIGLFTGHATQTNHGEQERGNMGSTAQNGNNHWIM